MNNIMNDSFGPKPYVWLIFVVSRIWFKVDAQQRTPQTLYYQDFWTPYVTRISDLIDMINSHTFNIPGEALWPDRHDQLSHI